MWHVKHAVSPNRACSACPPRRNSPIGVRLTKECLKLSIDAPSLEAAVAMEDRNQILAAQTVDFREGIVAFLQKRPARFGDN